MFNRLYKHGSNLEKGCLLQLRNLINRRNVASDITGRFNESSDFFELVVDCHILSAAMSYFGMYSTDDTPSKNDVPRNIPSKDKWTALSRAIDNIVDCYEIVHEMDQLSDQAAKALSETNPHEARIQSEHSYASSYQIHSQRIQTEHDYFNTDPPVTKKTYPTKISKPLSNSSNYINQADCT